MTRAKASDALYKTCFPDKVLVEEYVAEQEQQKEREKRKNKSKEDKKTK